MAIRYNNKTIRPAPIISVTKIHKNTDAGSKIGAMYNIVLEGTLLPNKGSPDADGVIATTGDRPSTSVSSSGLFGSMLEKREALEDLFSEDGHLLEVSSWDGTKKTYFSPVIDEIKFDPSTWTVTGKYSITMSAPCMMTATEADNDTIALYRLYESWADLSGNGHDLTPKNDPTITPWGAEFSTADDSYAESSSVFDFSGAAGVTLEFAGRHIGSVLGVERPINWQLNANNEIVLHV
ncbi:MAG: hypothetical protein WC967_12740, partial [Balneolaceae bacterium]